MRKLSLNPESSAALREFSESMPAAIQNIVESTERLLRVYQSVADTLGIHNQDFYDMLMYIKRAQEETAEAIQVLPKMLTATADKMDAYIASHPQIGAR